MPLKTVKKNAADALTLEWILQAKNYKLTLDKNRCVGCQICTVACPKEAIKTDKQPKISGKKVQKAKVDIDLIKCNFCGICDVTCPYGAVKVTLNDAHNLPILEKESYPQLVKDITVNTHKCAKECIECQNACPLKIIRISKVGFDGSPVQDVGMLSINEKKRVQVSVDIQKDYCPTCSACELKCAPGAIRVKKVFEGTIAINQQKCPDGCTDCLDVCPIPGALVLTNNKVCVNGSLCTFCGACKNVCPSEDALCVKRTKVNHTTIHSGTWNKALERITSISNAAKELKAQAAQNRRKVVEKRFVSEAVNGGS